MKARYPDSPCPTCGVYLPPNDLVWSLQDTLYLYDCPNHGGYRRSEKAMLKFRALASKASRENKSRPTSLELRLAEALETIGIPFQHNVRVGPFVRQNGRKVYYWLDIYLPDQRIDIECSPRFWHGRPIARERDERRKKDLESIGLLVLTLDETQLRNRSRLRQWIVEGLMTVLRQSKADPGQSTMTSRPAMEEIQVLPINKASHERQNLWD